MSAHFLPHRRTTVFFCVCVFSSHPFWTSSSLDVPAGVTQEEGHTGFLIHLPSAVRALIFVARRIQPFLSLVDHEVEFCVVVVVVVFVSHIQRIGCQPEKTTLHGGQSRSWSAEQGKENKRKSLAAYPPPPTPHTARSEKINKITRRIYRRYAGGRSRVRTRIPSARRLGLWVWLRKILHSRLR